MTIKIIYSIYNTNLQRNVPFTEWFQLDKVADYHRVIPAEDFMEQLAPKYWPTGKRIGWCWQHPNHMTHECGMKKGGLKPKCL